MGTQPRKSKPARPADKPALQRLEILLERELVRQIKVEALARDLSPSQVLADLWRNSPRKFVLRRAGGFAENPGDPGQTDGPGVRLADAG